MLRARYVFCTIYKESATMQNPLEDFHGEPLCPSPRLTDEYLYAACELYENFLASRELWQVLRLPCCVGEAGGGIMGVVTGLFRYHRGDFVVSRRVVVDNPFGGIKWIR